MLWKDKATLTHKLVPTTFIHDWLNVGLQTTTQESKQCPGRLLGIISWDPSVTKSNRSHVDIFQWFFFLHQFEVYSLKSSKTIRNVSLKLNRFISS